MVGIYFIYRPYLGTKPENRVWADVVGKLAYARGGGAHAGRDRAKDCIIVQIHHIPNP
jgi:hypothetical protein